MRVILVEDEKSARENMLALIQEIDPSIEVLTCLESIEQTIDWLGNNEAPDLAFFDIHLADGSSFEIFKQAKVNFPVVFTTAYSEYALNAFKVSSIDYLLKPIRKQELEFSINKFRELKEQFAPEFKKNLVEILQSIRPKQTKNYKRSILVRKYDGFVPVLTTDIAFFNIENGIVYCTLFDKEVHAIHENLDNIESQLNPNDFFRANRQVLLAKKSVAEASNYFGGRLVIKTNPEAKERIIVSKSKAGGFKKWLEY